MAFGHIPHPGCPSGTLTGAPVPRSCPFREKTRDFPCRNGPLLFWAIAGAGWPRVPEQKCRSRIFCAFSKANKEHGFIAIKMSIFGKERFKQRISGGVGTASTAEFFGDLGGGFLRRRGVDGGETLFSRRAVGLIRMPPLCLRLVRRTRRMRRTPRVLRKPDSKNHLGSSRVSSLMRFDTPKGAWALAMGRDYLYGKLIEL